MTPSAIHPDVFLPYMRDVSRCEQSLHELGLMWRMVEASAKLNCPVEAQSILPIMSATQAGFARLERELVQSLVEEKAGNVLAQIGTKARFVIDIVVRNLFERTADVGFLATDPALRAFVAGQDGDADAIRQRLHEYRAKYTVYNDILLTDTQGRVLVQLDTSTPLTHSQDPLIAATLAADGFVETFRATDLRPGQTQALIYSQRLLHPASGAVIGVLCLSFDFGPEMAGIFRSHRDRAGRVNLLLLDGENRVIASADERWIAPGTTVPTQAGGQPQVFIHEGREYLLQTCASAGYQGYPGPPGWQGQAMVPLAMAFSAMPRQVLRQLDAATASGLLAHARRFSPPLYEVMSATETIQRVVWNGQVITAEGRDGQQQLKAILDQISETGARSNEVFSRSISDLYETVLESRLDSAESSAQLLVDLLDRNLYERANDCRWWALTPRFRSELASERPDAAAITRILEEINRLYTVYRTLFVYDAQGRVLAASQGALDTHAADASATQLDAPMLQRVKSLPHTQAYGVTALAPSPLGDEHPTWVYHAAIRHPDDPSRVVGGIGIAFETARELQAMLQSCVADQAGVQAHFLDRSGRVIASTDPAHVPGSRLELPPAALSLQRGQSQAQVLTLDGHYRVLASAANAGYREFKTQDGYQDDVLAVVTISLGAVASGTQTARADWRPPALVASGPARMYATVWCGAHVLGLPAAQVTEAVPASRLTGRQTGDGRGRIGLLVPQPDLTLERSVWVYDLSRLLGLAVAPGDAAEAGEIVVLRRGQQHVGLRVDALHAVPEFADSQIVTTPLATVDTSALVTRLVKAVDGQPMIELLDVDRLLAHLGLDDGPPAGLRQ